LSQNIRRAFHSQLPIFKGYRIQAPSAATSPLGEEKNLLPLTGRSLPCALLPVRRKRKEGTEAITTPELSRLIGQRGKRNGGSGTADRLQAYLLDFGLDRGLVSQLFLA